MSDPIEALLSTPRLGWALIDELRTLCPALPSEGIVAGQAVASLLLRRLGRTGPINDIDVFVIRPLVWTEERPLKARAQYAPIGEIGRSPDADYDETLTNSHRAFLARIGAVTCEGLLNRIEYQVKTDDGCDVLALIAGNFDLNCVQVGIDLGSGRLCFTDAFREYLHTQQLFIANGHTPVSSLARLARKAEQLGAYCDFEAEGRFAAACALLFGAGSDFEEAADYVGEITYAKIGPQLAFVERWFHLAPMSAFPRHDDGYYPSPGGATTGRCGTFRLWRAHVAPAVAAAILERPSSCPAIRVGRVEGLKTVTLEDTRLGLMEFSVLDREFRSGAMNRRKLTKLRTVLRHAARPVLATCLANPRLYIRDNVSAQSVEELNSYFWEHPGLAHNLLGLSHEQQLRITRRLRGRGERGDGWVVGVVETAHLWLDEPVGPFIARDGLEALIARYDQQTKVVLGARLPDGLLHLPLFEITRIDSARSLSQDGKQMKHWVGGYAPMLAVPGHYFLSIRFRLGWRVGHRSTLYADLSGHFGVWQHVTSANRWPSLANEVAAQVLMTRLRCAHAGRPAMHWRDTAGVVSAVLRRKLRSWLGGFIKRPGVWDPRHI